jgi:hypothetical protein
MSENAILIMTSPNVESRNITSDAARKKARLVRRRQTDTL